jgi:hypothetical protein
VFKAHPGDGRWALLPGKVAAALEKRRVDCVTELARAASACAPVHFFSEMKFKCAGGVEALRKYVLPRYFSYIKDPVKLAEKIDACLDELLSMQGQHGGYWAEAATKASALKDQPNNAALFWIKSQDHAPLFWEVAAKLCSSFAGQGAAERCNKYVAGKRTKQSNRQLEGVTGAYLHVRFGLSVKKQIAAPEKRPFLKVYQDKVLSERVARKEREVAIALAREVLAGAAEEEEELRGGGEEVNIEDSLTREAFEDFQQEGEEEEEEETPAAPPALVGGEAPKPCFLTGFPAVLVYKPHVFTAVAAAAARGRGSAPRTPARAARRAPRTRRWRSSQTVFSHWVPGCSRL